MTHSRPASVSGAAQCLGRAIAERLARDGCSLVVADADHEGAMRTSEALRADGHEAVAISLDAGDEAAVTRAYGYATHRAFLQGDLTLDEDSDVIRPARKINLDVSPDLDQRYVRNFVADLTVRYRDGSSEHIFLDRAKGMPSNPFTADEHRAKLNELAGGVVGERQADRLFDLIEELRPDRPVSDLAALIHFV